MRLVHPTFHVTKLKRWAVDTSDKFPGREQNLAPSPPVIQQGEEMWEVEKIVKKRVKKVKGKSVTEYLVLWKGYPEWDKTWEPAINLKEAQDVVKEFEQQHHRATGAVNNKVRPRKA